MLGINNLVPMNLGGLNSMLGNQNNFRPLNIGNSGPSNNLLGDLGWNLPTAELLLGGLNSIGNLWGAGRALSLSKDQFNFQKDVTNTNLNNQIQSYNTALEDRSRARAHTEGRSQSDADAYYDRHKLTR